MEVRATRTIPASPEAIFAFLEEPDRHWQLLGRRLEPLQAYDGERSQVRLHGPLGVRRTLWIRMAVSRPPHELVGRVQAGGETTIGTVRWEIRAVAGGTGGTGGAAGDAGGAAGAGDAGERTSLVALTARTDVAGWLDRLLLVCGGARWLRRSLERTLAALTEQVR